MGTMGQKKLYKIPEVLIGKEKREQGMGCQMCLWELEDVLDSNIKVSGIGDI